MTFLDQQSSSFHLMLPGLHRYPNTKMAAMYSADAAAAETSAATSAAIAALKTKYFLCAIQLESIQHAILGTESVVVKN